MENIKTQSIFNAFDEKALLVGLERQENESNIDLHNRIVNRVTGNSTNEGLADWILDAFNTDDAYPSGVLNDVTTRYVFYSTRTPLSLSEYTKLKDPELPYQYPSIKDYDADMTYTLEYETAERDSAGGDKWFLYKTATGVYSRIWISNYQVSEIQLNYLTLIDGVVYEVEESARRPE